MASKVDTNDPNVRRMVYNMYRGILGNYNHQANTIISSLPKERVVEDKGISRRVESMIRQSNQIAGNNGNGHQSGGEPLHHGGPPPPPPPPMQSAAPIRIASEIGPAKKCSEPPAAIQNAMMTKDKKPFTYTPGGLDLAEIRSPRMARRINRNAHMEDSCSGPQLKAPGPPVQPHSLPPAALAAMQPQIAIPVFPPGNDASPRAHHTSPPSSSGSPPPIPSVGANTGVPPPPPPPPPMLPVGGSVGSPPPPPPPMPDGSISPQMHSTQGNNNNQQTYRPKNGNHSPPTYLQDIQNRPALRPVGQPGQNRPPPDFVSEIPCHSPLRPVNHPPRSSYEPSNASPIQVQLKPVSPKSSQAQSPSHSSPPYVPQQPTIPNQYRNQESSNPAQTLPKPAQDMYPQKQTQQSTKPSVYIPPRQSSPPNVTPIRQTPPSPAALNKAPAPWMTSRQVQKDSPPWAVRQGTPEDKGTPPPVSSGTPMTRVIPIQIEGREPTPNYQQQMAQQMQQMQIQAQRQMQQQQLNQIPHYATLPKQSHSFSRQDSSSSISSQSQQQQQGRTRIIPIQIEGGTSSETTNQQKTYNTQQSFTNHNASPVAFGQNRFQNSAQGPGLQRTSSVDTTDNKNRQLQSQVSWTQGGSNPIQSRSFRVLQKITGSEDQPSAPINQSPTGETYLVNRVLPNREGVPGGADNNTEWECNSTHPQLPPQNYPNPNYWYYPIPPQTVEEQQQFWEHYNAMCAYMAHMNAAALRYSPYPMYPAVYPTYLSDNDEYSGYSSSDEMTYYGQMFMNQCAQRYAQENCNKTNEQVDSINNYETDSTDSKESEQFNALRSIKSVPNINIYKEKENNELRTNSEEEEEDDDDDEDEGDDYESEYGSEASNHLSVIMEESERSSAASRDSSSSTINNHDEDNENSTVTVRLPLQFKISRSDNDEEVTTVIVGASEVEAISEQTKEVSEKIDDGSRETSNKNDSSTAESSTEEEDEDEEEDDKEVIPEETLIITDIVREDSDPDITATICLKRNKSVTEETSLTLGKNEITEKSIKQTESPIDFWKELEGDKENDNSVRTNNNTPGSQSQISEDDFKQEESDYHWEDDSSSTSLQTVKKGQSGSGSEVEATGTADEIEDVTIQSPMECEKLTDTNKEPLTDGVDEKPDNTDDESSESEEETSDSSSSSSDDSDDNDEDDDDDDSKDFNESRSERDADHLDYEANTREKLKSQEESEEDDSGVTSDISRHISETDTDIEGSSELRKMSRCQRAATHSRLFKLLQEECGLEEDTPEESLSVKKERLMLPLSVQSSSEQESLSSSSGINSPASPTVTDKLVKELVQSLLSKKKGRHFRKLPMDKLYAAALRILQEDMDPYDTGSTSDESNLFLSPVGNTYNQQQIDTRFIHPELANPENYGANYFDYCNYYNTWANVNNYSNNEALGYDILPSKTFRILQETSQPEGGYKTPVKGLLVRCPRVPNSQDSINPNDSNTKNPCESEPTSSTLQET